MLDPYIQQYGRRLYGLCRTLCANSFDADDLYQETWLKAFRHFSQYDPARPFEPWLTQICVNTYRSVLRRAFRSPILPFRTTQEQDEALQSVPAPEAADYSDLHGGGRSAGKAEADGDPLLLPGHGHHLHGGGAGHPARNSKVPAEQSKK